MNLPGDKDNYDRFKPAKYKDYLTMAEVCDIVKRDRRRITQLEAEGKIPSPIRVKVGRLRVRLYDAQQVEAIKRYFANAKPGRPASK